MSLEPQAALEAAVAGAIIAADLGYDATTCGRCFDGMPPPRSGLSFVAVWAGGRRTTGKGRLTALDQYMGVSVTVTIRTVQPFDRKVKHRDELEARMNAIVALVHRDSLDFSIRNAANVLAGYRNPASNVFDAPVGFCEALGWESTEDVRTVDGSWFWAGANPSKESGITQTAHFRGARHIQYHMTAQ